MFYNIFYLFITYIDISYPFPIERRDYRRGVDVLLFPTTSEDICL